MDLIVLALSGYGRLWLMQWGIAGDVEELPEGSQEGLPDPNQFRIRPAEYEPTPDAQPASRRVTFEGLPPPAADAELAEPRPSGTPRLPCSDIDVRAPVYRVMHQHRLMTWLALHCMSEPQQQHIIHAGLQPTLRGLEPTKLVVDPDCQRHTGSSHT